jgi:hypothetical protein
MGFFDDVPLPPPPEPEETTQRPWLGPPDNMIGGPASIDALLARTSDVAVAAHSFIAYPTGVEFSLQVRGRSILQPNAFWDLSPGGNQLTPERLRLGLVYADGRKATNLGGFPLYLHEAHTPPSEPVLMPHGGHGGGRAWSQTLWLWPLPPPGPLGLVIEWPFYGIDETRVDIDADALVEAANQAIELWPGKGTVPTIKSSMWQISASSTDLPSSDEDLGPDLDSGGGTDSDPEADQ